jgi:hypothetical protein
VSVTSRRIAAARRFASGDPAELLYGALVTAAVLATVSAHGEGASYVAVATAIVLAVYWMAHVYTHALSEQFRGDRRHLLKRLRTSSVHEASILLGGLPAIVVYLLATMFGAGPSTAAFVALYFSVGLLIAAGYVGAHAAGLTGRAVVAEAVGAGLFGVLIVIAKSLLH